MTETKRNRIGFIGAGRMATALARGFLAQNAAQAENMVACDVWPASREAFTEATGVECLAESLPVIQNSDVLFLAVKPQVLKDVTPEISRNSDPDQLIVSIAAGVTLTDLGRSLGDHRQLIRVMPNTPCLVGAGAAGMAASESVSDEDRQFIRGLLETVGICFELPEKQLDVITGLSGSGPAYVFQLIEAMSDGAVLMGLQRDIALQLAAQTVLGAAKMALETGQHPGQLKDGVTSRGAQQSPASPLSNGAVSRAAVIDAIEAGTLRSQELAGNK